MCVFKFVFEFMCKTVSQCLPLPSTALCQHFATTMCLWTWALASTLANLLSIMATATTTATETDATYLDDATGLNGTVWGQLFAVQKNNLR